VASVRASFKRSCILLSDEEDEEEEHELSASGENCSILFDRVRRLLGREEGAFRSLSVEEPFASVTQVQWTAKSTNIIISTTMTMLLLYERTRLRFIYCVD